MNQAIQTGETPYSEADALAKANLMKKWAKQQKQFQAKQHFRQLISYRKINKGRKAGRKTRLYV